MILKDEKTIIYTHRIRLLNVHKYLSVYTFLVLYINHKMGGIIKFNTPKHRIGMSNYGYEYIKGFVLLFSFFVSSLGPN